MFFLILSILSSAAISVVMRLGEGKVKSNLSMIATNYLTCLLISWGMMGFGDPFPAADGLGAVLGMGTFNGFFYMMALLLSQYNISRSGVILPSVFSRIGALLIPMVTSILFFSEMPTGIQFFGAVLAIVSIFVLNFQKGSGGLAGMFNLALFALLIADGLASIMAKFFNELGNPALEAHFLFYTFMTAFTFCVLVILYKKERPALVDIAYGVGVGVPNFMGSIFVMKALEQIPAVILYPTRSVATILVIMAAGMLLFKEKLTKRQLSAVAVILVSLVLLNM